MSKILVTGGSRGIGRAICLRLVRDSLARGEAPKIVVTATGTSPDLQAVIAELQSMGADALAVTGDLNDTATPARIVDDAVSFCGGLDILVHNAGGNIASPLLKTSVEDWDTVFAVNCRAFFLLGKAANRALHESRGSLCAIGSGAVGRVQPFSNAYPAAKTALLLLVQQMACEWGRYGIRVNCVSPGLSVSRSTEEAFPTAEDKARAGAHIPLQRLGWPEDTANAVAFVVGPDAAYLTGENIHIDGGQRLVGSGPLLAEGGAGYSANKPGGGMRPSLGGRTHLPS